MAPPHHRRRNNQSRGRSRTPQTQPAVPESQSRADAERAAAEAKEVARQHQRRASRLQTIAESFSASGSAGASEASGSRASEASGRADGPRSNSRLSTSIARRRNRSNYRDNRNSAVVKTPVLRRRVTEVARLDKTNRDGTTTMEVINTSLSGGVTTDFEATTHSGGALERTTQVAAIAAAAHQVQKETGARELCYQIEPVLDNHQRFMDANIMSVRTTTSHGRVRHAPVAAFQQRQVADISGQPDTRRCVNCESTSHSLKDCLRAYRGYIFACILCEKRDHLTDRCHQFASLDFKEKFKVLVLDRANKPPLGVKDEASQWWVVLSDFVGSDQHSPEEQFVGFPWSPKYAEDVTWEDDGEYAIGLQREYDAAFDASLLPVQFSPNDIQSVWDRFWPHSPSRNDGHQSPDDSAQGSTSNVSSTQTNAGGRNAGVELFPAAALRRSREMRNRSWNSGNMESGVHDA